jgi:hypothetical protein
MISMTSTWRGAAETLVSDLRHVFGSRLHAVVAYGAHIEGVAEAPLTCLAIVENLSVEDLEACARVEPEWERRRLATPLVLVADEFRRSLDAFPLEYGEILRAHERVFGPNPFDGVEIRREDYRRACEAQIKSHLVHLREEFIEAGNRPHRVAELVTTSAPAFAALLRHVANLSGARVTSRSEAAMEGARAVGLADGVVRDVLSLERPGSLPMADAARLFPPYLAAVEQLARAVDTWSV